MAAGVAFCCWFSASMGGWTLLCAELTDAVAAAGAATAEYRMWCAVRGPVRAPRTAARTGMRLLLDDHGGG
ncbi:hypothetical protein VR45_30785, partial [Streptomyces sp. NRRL S-495]